MRLLKVKADEMALITKRGRVVRWMGEGKVWVWPWQSVRLFSIPKPLHIDENLDLILNQQDISTMLQTYTIEDGFLAIELKDGIYSRVITSGKFGYWKSGLNYSILKIDLSNPEVDKNIPLALLQKPAVLAYLKVFAVEAYQKGLLWIDGQLIKALDPGVYYYWKSDKLAVVKTIDIRTQLLTIAGQELLTKDKAGIRINLNAQYQVMDIEKALIQAKDYEVQLYNSIQLQLRSYVGGQTLDQLLASRDAAGETILEGIGAYAEDLGVRLISCGIKDIILPGEVKDIMNQVLIAQKKAQANNIMRQEETASTRSLLNTAKLLEENSMLWKLKEMEYMEKIAEKIGKISIGNGSQVLDQLKTLLVSK